MAKEATKTYVLELNNGNLRKVTVPATWKLTFGPTIPYAGKGSGVSNGTALRFYEGSSKENLRAAFTDVRAFRDASIEVQERRTETKSQVVAQNGPGGMSNAIVEARITQWVDPDDETPGERNETAAAPYLAQLLPARTY